MYKKLSRQAARRRRRAHRRWRDLTTGERVAVVALGTVQTGLALFAWADLASRPTALVRGRKWVWASVIGVNVVGPILYLRRGRMFPRIP